jgi:RHS repeat-associated protein
VSAAGGTLSAEYAYGPFGEPLRVTGPMGKTNPLRFSTQYGDDVTETTKYLYRDYQAGTGRWLSRDPIGEGSASIAVYGFVCNTPIGTLDVWGLYDNSCCDDCHIDYWKKSLLKRYQYAKQFLDPRAPKRPFDIHSTWSCFNLALNILQFIAPTPPCWKCHTENRKKKTYYPFYGWVETDENSIICISQPRSGASETIVFDYYKEWVAVPYSIFTSNYPIPGTSSLDGRSDDCSHKDVHHWGNPVYLDNIVNPAPSIGNL